MDRTPQDFWDSAYETLKLVPARKRDPVRVLIERHIPKGRGSCLEVGCYPGRYLAVFGGLGYELNGIDLTPKVSSALPDWLRSRGYRIGEIIQGDFLKHRMPRLYDVVCSFGFIEHFDDWESVVRRHIELVAPNGYLLITTPNFNGLVQNRVHYYLDRETYDTHNRSAMKPLQWAGLAESLGLEVLWKGWFGGVYLWRPDKIGTKLLLYSIYPALRLGCTLLPRRAYAGYCGLVARRRQA